FESADGTSFYYAREPKDTTLWKVPVDGGEEVQILDSLDYFSNFAVTGRGIYYSPVPARELTPLVRFYDFSTRKSSTAAMVGRPLELGLSVSPDGKWMLYTQVERGGADLMLVENFRLP